MLWRHLSRVRAWSAAGLLTTCTLFAPATAALAEPAEPVPSADTAATESVSVLEARKAGDLALEVRGAGQDRVKLTVKNTSGRRLKVVLPPGLVASSATAQGRGFQSMGLGSVSNTPGGFGAFQSVGVKGENGFRSVAVRGDETDHALTLPEGKTVELSVVSVCLNFGVRTPNAQDKFELVDVDDYTTDPRARKALRSLATYGTSHGVAQAAMWRVCNDVPFALMSEQAGKVMNPHEVALASRFVDALDASSATDLVDPAYLTENRLFVRVVGEGALARDAERIAGQMEGLSVMGLPVRALDAGTVGAVSTPAVLMHVVLKGDKSGETSARVLVSQADAQGRWIPLGKTNFREGSAVSDLDGAGLARALDRSVSSAFVSVKTAKKASNVTVFRVENRLPFTLSNVSLKAGNSSGSPTVTFRGLGIAPSRSATVPVQAATATLERVDFNGL